MQYERSPVSDLHARAHLYTRYLREARGAEGKGINLSFCIINHELSPSDAIYRRASLRRYIISYNLLHFLCARRRPTEGLEGGGGLLRCGAGW